MSTVGPLSFIMGCTSIPFDAKFEKEYKETEKHY